jgi:hypothetical protein
MNLALKMCEGWGCNVGMGVIDCCIDIETPPAMQKHPGGMATIGALHEVF